MRNRSIGVSRCPARAVGVIDGNFLDLGHMARQKLFDQAHKGMKRDILENLPIGEHRQWGQR